MMSAGNAYELPDDDVRLGEVVHVVEAGNVVFITRHGEPVAAITPPDMVMLAGFQAVEMADAALARTVKAGEAILAAAGELRDERVRKNLTDRVNAMIEAAEDAADLAAARLTLARIEAGEETVVPWEQALAELADK
jgi:antitoxin (DNA-binding transcriptional repressor) of toxin-antitoxin stability system